MVKGRCLAKGETKGFVQHYGLWSEYYIKELIPLFIQSGELKKMLKQDPGNADMKTSTKLLQRKEKIKIKKEL